MISTPALRMSLLAHFWEDMTRFHEERNTGTQTESAEMVPPQERM